MVRPWFYDDFVCTADKCSDNCCKGWEIDIDDDALARFKEVPGEFGERLRRAICVGEDGQAVFALSCDDSCALLREDGLCELILNCGSDILCDICALHPRFFNDTGEVSEGGLGLCCEEVCRLLYSSDEPFRLICDDEDFAAMQHDDESTADFRRERKRLFGILQDRRLGILDRLGKCAEYAWNVQQRLEGENIPQELPQEWQSITDEWSMLRLFDTLSAMESINDDWADTLSRLKARGAELLSRLGDFLADCGEVRYEHIAVYGVFRHLSGCCADGAFYGRAMLACCSAFAVMLLDCTRYLDGGVLDDRGAILDLKLYSKQVEYSQENIEMFLEEYG